MQLEKEEVLQLLKIISLIFQEACWDYSSAGKFSVLNVNGNSMVMYKSQIELLSNLKRRLEKEI